jgi:hypothetical protein
MFDFGGEFFFLCQLVLFTIRSFFFTTYPGNENLFQHGIIRKEAIPIQ